MIQDLSFTITRGIWQQDGLLSHTVVALPNSVLDGISVCCHAFTDWVDYMLVQLYARNFLQQQVVVLFGSEYCLWSLAGWGIQHSDVCVSGECRQAVLGQDWCGNTMLHTHVHGQIVCVWMTRWEHEGPVHTLISVRCSVVCRQWFTSHSACVQTTKLPLLTSSFTSYYSNKWVSDKWECPW